MIAAEAKDQAEVLNNILADVAKEKLRRTEWESAALNILEDFQNEQRHHQDVQKAIYNVLQDLRAENSLLAGAQAGLIRSGEQVQATLREREVLLQEVHHRVKNNLQIVSSLIRMQTRELSDMASRSALEECQNRVLSMALVHEKLYQSSDYASVLFSDYARSLAHSIFDATGVSRGNVELSVEFEEIALAVDKAIPCGLILNELVSNALKHAFANERRGTLRVELRRVGAGQLELVVADDGVGMNAGLGPATADSLGMQLVTTLVEQLEGELAIVQEAGTSFRIRFPLGVSA